MKAARRIGWPSTTAVAILEQMKPLATKPDDYVFPGQRGNSPLSGLALLMLLRQIQAQLR